MSALLEAPVFHPARPLRWSDLSRSLVDLTVHFLLENGEEAVRGHLAVLTRPAIDKAEERAQFIDAVVKAACRYNQANGEDEGSCSLYDAWQQSTGVDDEPTQEVFLFQNEAAA